MDTMYKRIDNLCKSNGISVAKMCKELKITRSCLSELNAGRTQTLSAINTNKIAKFFEVSSEYLTDGVENDEVNDNDIKFALFNGSEGITDEMFDEVKQFAEMVKLREEMKNKKE